MWCIWLFCVENGYFMCYFSDDVRYGVICCFGCYFGYKLIGNMLLECFINGYWNNNLLYCESRRIDFFVFV